MAGTAEVYDEITDSLVDDLRARARAALEGVQVGLDDDTGQPSTIGKPMLVSSTDDRAIVYATDSGEPRLVPVNMLGKTLRKRRGGQKAFVAADPKTGKPMEPVPEYRRGNLMCFLHPDHPERDRLEEMGIGRGIVCGDNETAPAGHIPTQFDLIQHEKKHKRSYEIRERFLQREREDEARAEQRRYTEAILELARGKGGEAADAPVYFCTKPGCRRFFDSDDGRKIHESKSHGGE